MKTNKQTKSDQKSGQAIIFLMMVLVIGTLAVLWNFDVHNITSTKIRINNAGDAAALSAARWQGITLNMIGELNLVQAAYVCDNMVDPADSNAVEQLRLEVYEIAELRSRLALNGPLMGLVSAQAAALQNLNEKDQNKIEDNASGYMKRRGADFQNSGGYYKGVAEEPYIGAWKEYGDLLTAIGNNTMVVDCANAEYFLFYESNHTLLNPNFYHAVAGGYWCWFKNGSSRNLLESYMSFSDWDPLPGLKQDTSVNAEYFGADLKLWEVSLLSYYHPDGNNYVGRLTNYYSNLELEYDELVEQFGEYAENTEPLGGANLGELPLTMWLQLPWHYYEWSKWLRARWQGSGQYFPNSDEFFYPEGWKVKDEYNYGGANAAVDCYIDAVNITPNMRVSTDWIQWRAAAKPFGYLEDPADPEIRRSPVHFGLVLPAFHDTRLIHNAVSTRKNGVNKPGYDEHIYEHLPSPEYMDEGVEAIKENKKCYWCKQLIKWEEPNFRQRGLDWLEENAEAIENGTKCRSNPNSNPSTPPG